MSALWSTEGGRHACRAPFAIYLPKNIQKGRENADRPNTSRGGIQLGSPFRRSSTNHGVGCGCWGSRRLRIWRRHQRERVHRQECAGGAHVTPRRPWWISDPCKLTHNGASSCLDCGVSAPPVPASHFWIFGSCGFHGATKKNMWSAFSCIFPHFSHYLHNFFSFFDSTTKENPFFSRLQKIMPSAFFSAIFRINQDNRILPASFRISCNFLVHFPHIFRS